MTTERRLLLACLVEGQADVIRDLARRPLHWELVIELASSTSIGAAVAERLSTASVDVPEQLWNAYVHNCAQNQALLADLVEVTRLLADEGIASVPIKGAALAARDANLVRVRHMDDIDLLVEESSFAKARAILVAHGHRDDALLVSPRGTPIDLHVRAPGSRSPFNVVIGATDVIELQGVALHVPTLVALREQLALHVVVHHGALPKYWPRHVLDLTAIDGPSAPRSLLASAALGLSRAVHAAVVTEAATGEVAPLSSSFLFPSRRRAAVVGVACLGVKAAGIIAEDGLDAGRRIVRPGVEPLSSRVRSVAGRWLGV